MQQEVTKDGGQKWISKRPTYSWQRLPSKREHLFFLASTQQYNISCTFCHHPSHAIYCFFSLPLCKVNSLCAMLSLISALSLLSIVCWLHPSFILSSHSVWSALLRLGVESSPLPYHHFTELKIGSSELENWEILWQREAEAAAAAEPWALCLKQSRSWGFYTNSSNLNQNLYDE